MNYLAVFIGGGLGSIVRYSISLMIPKDITNFPLATFLSNLIACIVLAVVIRYGVGKMDDKSLLLAVTGFCGGFSTFSTFSLENILLIQDGHWGVALANILVSLVVCGTVMYYIIEQ